uniref:Ribosomal protein S8 n=1 Tax=Storeatula sp. CCMP1868 TaxID=195070 RepID=A0A2P1G873_9CRYP|nr:ribosomal protein S8 [Storeatula sp. CCMP1868]AVM81149.1 ribosomal protein S8 [Storeatula sp. CCMP1868]
MKDTLIRHFLSNINNLNRKKHAFAQLDYNKTNHFIATFLTKEGYLRGFFFFQKYLKKKICVIPKYDVEDKSSILFIEKKNKFFNNSQFIKRKGLTKICNGLGIGLISTIKGFISNESTFWLKIGGKHIFKLK